MRVGGSLRQILIVALTAIAAVTIGQALRQAVDRANASPTPIVAPSDSPAPSP